jgi:hypothetical protein
MKNQLHGAIVFFSKNPRNCGKRSTRAYQCQAAVDMQERRGWNLAVSGELLHLQVASELPPTAAATASGPLPRG